jgi:mycoredoxin
MEQHTELTFYGTSWCGDCRRARILLDRHCIPYCYVDINKDKAAAQFVESVNHGCRSVPTIVWPDGSMLVEPSMSELAKKLGVTQP